MSLKAHNINQLSQLKNLLSDTKDFGYTEPLKIISGSTVGQHIRHILEFYICLKQGINKGNVSYDERKRDHRIEQNKEYAIEIIDQLCAFISSTPENIELTFTANYSENTDKSLAIKTSLYRELAYALDHTIHHLAIIKIALSNMGVTIDENLGVAPSTIRHRQQVCAQ